MIVLGCKYFPDLFGDGYEIVVLLFFLVYDSVEVIELVEGYLVEGFTVGYKIVVNFSRMFFANFFMFFFIIFTQVIVTYILSPILKPLSADNEAMVKLLLFKDFAFIIEQFVEFQTLDLKLLLWGFGIVDAWLGVVFIVVVGTVFVFALVFVSAHYF